MICLKHNKKFNPFIEQCSDCKLNKPDIRKEKETSCFSEYDSKEYTF